MLRQFYLNIYFGLVDLFVLMKFIYEPSSLWILKKLQIHSWFAQVYIHTKHIDTHVSGSTHTPTRTFSCRHIESRVVLVVISLNLYRVQAAVSVVLVARGSRGQAYVQREEDRRESAQSGATKHTLVVSVRWQAAVPPTLLLPMESNNGLSERATFRFRRLLCVASFISSLSSTILGHPSCLVSCLIADRTHLLSIFFIRYLPLLSSLPSPHPNNTASTMSQSVMRAVPQNSLKIYK